MINRQVLDIRHSYLPNSMILVIHILISVWIITIQATEKYSSAMYYIRYGSSTLLYTAYTVYTVQTALHCSSMYA